MNQTGDPSRASVSWLWFLVHRVAPLAALAATLGLAWFGFWRYHLKRFHPVREGVLYRVAQPTEFGFRHLASEHKIKTVLSVRLEDPALYQGLLDPGAPNGQPESSFVPTLGVKHIQWPMGEEAYWPWLTPWQFEEFYKLFDNQENLPVVVHCVGGRHRTGTFTALFQMEYNRLPAEAAIAEMHSYDFGRPVPVHDHNLRTYLPRPRPDSETWKALVKGLFGADPSQAPADYEGLVRLLREEACDVALRQRVGEYLRQGLPFGLCLVHRLIDTPTDPLASDATRLASEQLQAPNNDASTWAIAAALVADFGSPDQQQALYKLLEQEPDQGEPTPRYQAVVAGVTNRYTPNRIAYLLPLLSDRRKRPEKAARGFRYCDTAVARLTSITDEPLFVERYPLADAWSDGVRRAEKWFSENPEKKQLVQMLPPTGKNVVRGEKGRERDGRNWR